MDSTETRVLKLTFAYDGAGFHGWQRQPGVRTVQGEVEEVARRVLREPLDVIGASRTDAGVHARGQVAHVVLQGRIPTEKVLPALGHRLPDDIALVAVEPAAPGFHAIRCAVGKHYRYRLHADPGRPVAALTQRYAWHIWRPMDVEPMQIAARGLLGTHDFAGFATAGSPRENTIRTIFRLDVRRIGAEVLIDVEGNGFLYNMVRNIVGTLVEIGRGHWPAERVGEIIAAGERCLAGPTAPPHGLCLEQVYYPPWTPPHGT